MEQLGEVVCLNAISEKVDTEKLIRDGMTNTQMDTTEKQYHPRCAGHKNYHNCCFACGSDDRML